MRSMTGFGKGEAPFGAGYRFVVEVSSVNRKQLEIRTSFPPELAAQEIPARRTVQEYISRGAVQLRVSVNSGGNAGQGSVNRELLRSLIREAQMMRREAGLPEGVAVEVLMSLPGVIGASVISQENAPEAAEALEKALRAALEKFQEMRTVEGEALRRDFLSRLAELESLLEQIEPQVAGLAATIRDRLLEKLAAEKIPAAADDDRLLKEVLFYADKSDVTEEITRLRSHFGQFRRFLDETKPVGRSLDFLMQELFREITTLGNKAGIPAVSPLVVAFKSELEKLREQIQNVE